MDFWGNIQLSVDQDAVFSVFFELFGYKLALAIEAFRLGLLSVKPHGPLIELLKFTIGPLGFGLDHLQILQGERGRLFSVLRLLVPHKLGIIELLGTLRIVNLQA